MRQSIDCHFILFSALHSISEVYIFHLGAIELTIATMSKEQRCSVDEVYVIGFVPTYLLPSKCHILP